MIQPPSPEELRLHEELDHVINGWVALIAAVCNFLPLFSTSFAGLLKVWPFPLVAISVYFFFHTEPDVLWKYGTWLRAWMDPPTYQHRLMTLGASAGACAELALVFFHKETLLTRMLFPAGLVGAGVIFYGHHHSDNAVVKRQHDIMAFLFVLTGLTWLCARMFPVLVSLRYAWPVLFGTEAYLFLTYTEEEGGGPEHATSHAH